MLKRRNEQKKGDTSLITVNPGDPKFWIPETYTGPLVDMFPHAIKHPATMESSLMRARRIIVRQGIDHVGTERARRKLGDENIIVYNAFSDIYGMERLQSRFVATLNAAARNGEHAYAVFFMEGPAGTAKSAIANKIKRFYVDSEPALMVATSQMRAHPLCVPAMIPTLANAMAKSGRLEEAADYRLQFLQGLNLVDALNFGRFDTKRIFAKNRLEPTIQNMCKLTSGVDFVSVLVDALGFPRAVRSVVGFPDLAVAEPFMRAAQNGGSDPIAMMKNLEIKGFRFLDGDEGSVGIGTLTETEPLKYDNTVMFGEEDLTHYGMKDVDAEQTVRLNGIYNRAHRGTAEFVEMAKNSVMAFRNQLEATQSRRIQYPAPHTSRTTVVDLLILAHTNTIEYKKFVTTPGNEPYEDRFNRLDVGHPVASPDIEKVLEKMWDRTDYANPDSDAHLHVDPVVWDMAARFLSATRVTPHPDIPSLMKLVDILAGRFFDYKETGTRFNIQAIYDRAGELQGMQGATIRFQQKVIDEMAGLAEANGRNYVMSRDVFDWLDRTLRLEREFKGEDTSKDATTPPASTLGKWHMFVKNDLKKWRARRLAQAVRIAMQIFLDNQKSGKDVGMQSDLRQAFTSRYVSIVDEMMADESSVTESDRLFVTDIEANLGITSSQRNTYREGLDRFRNQVLSARKAHTKKAVADGKLEEGEEAELPFTYFEPLRRAIDKKIMKEIPAATAISILRAQNAETSSQKKGGLATMQRLYGLTEEMALKIVEEVEQKNYMNELGDEDEY